MKYMKIIIANCCDGFLHARSLKGQVWVLGGPFEKTDEMETRHMKMKTTTSLIALAVAGTFAAGVAMAQPGPDGPGEAPGAEFLAERFAEVDTNGDGVITEAEARAKAEADFAAADTDGNGSLDEDEARAAHEARREERHAAFEAAREARRAGRGDGPGRGFEHVDDNDNGAIDEDEFTERGMRLFTGADLDENGEVTQTEMQLAARYMMEGFGGHHRGGCHGGRHHGPGDDE